MPKEREYDVDVTRIAYANLTLRVKARNVNAAKLKALDMAGDEEFSEDASEYQAGSVTLVNND